MLTLLEFCGDDVMYAYRLVIPRVERLPYVATEDRRTH